MFDEEGGAGGGAPAGAPPSGGNPGATAPGASATGNPGSTGAPAAGSPPANTPKTYTYPEDRSNWVPSHRLRQSSEQIQKLQRDLELATQRVAALSGVQPPKPAMDPQFEQIRQQLLHVAPELKDVFESVELLKDLKGMNLKQTIEALQGFVNQSWQQQGGNVLRTLGEKIKQVYGGAELSPKQVQRIARNFISELEDDDQLRARYEAGDPAVLDDFIKDFTGGLLDPYRRSTAAAAAGASGNRAAARILPRAGGGAPIAGNAGRSVKPSDGDAFHKSAFDAFQRG